MRRSQRLANMDEFKALAGRIASLLEHGIVMNESMLTDAYEAVIRDSIKGMHRQLDKLTAEIKQMSRELDEQADVDPEFERVRQETRDGMYAYLQAADDTTAETAPGPLLPKSRTSNGRGAFRTATFPAEITATQ